jgi:hypothetical protein
MILPEGSGRASGDAEFHPRQTVPFAGSPTRREEPMSAMKTMGKTDAAAAIMVSLDRIG